ncbi:MAG: hypothetical protein ACE5LH_05795, partial [Fidelibacterota bacterium]
LTGNPPVQTGGGSGWYGCPMMRGGTSGMGMMNRGMMNMMGPGMMGRGMRGMGMMNRGMMSDWRGWTGEDPWSDLNYGRSGELLEPLSKDNAEEIARYYVKRLDNPRLKVGKISEKDKVFEVEIVTRDNSTVDTILIEKDTGWIYPANQ